MTSRRNSDETHELVLFADNDGDLYRQSFTPIIANLKKKVAKGTYSPTLAIKLWMYHAERAAKKYAKEHLSSVSEWSRVFPPSVRKEAAVYWESYARREYLGVTSHDRSRSRRDPGRQKLKETWAKKASNYIAHGKRLEKAGNVRSAAVWFKKAGAAYAKAGVHHRARYWTNLSKDLR